MFINETGCCAVDEIDGLSEHKSAREAMINLCRGIEGYKDDVDFYNDDGELTLLIPGFFVFTGVVEQPSHEKGGKNPKYGPDFAAFIRENKLGSVSETKKTPNRLNHPDHLVKVWVWSPAPNNLKKWWRENQ